MNLKSDKRILAVLAMVFASSCIVNDSKAQKINDFPKDRDSMMKASQVNNSNNIDLSNVHRPSAINNPPFEISFAPDYVASDIPRRFLVEIEFPGKFTDTDLVYDDCVKLLGQSDIVSELGKNGLDAASKPRNLRRFYFQTLKRAPQTKIIIRSGESGIFIPFVIWDYNDLRQERKINGFPFPRRYPLNKSLPTVKQNQVFKPLEEGSRKEPVQISKFVISRTHFDEKFNLRDYTPEEFWRIAPDTSALMRMNHPGAPDPIHKDKVYSASGNSYYPYKMMMPVPGDVDSWYLTSPVDGRKIPDNDWGKGDYSGKYMDDGMNGIEFDGRRNYYLAQLAVMRGLETYAKTKEAAAFYSATGDIKYARLALVGLCRIGIEHNYLSTMMQSRRTHVRRNANYRLTEAVPPNIFGNSGFFVDGIWTSGQMEGLSQAYDQVLPAIAKDEGIYKFLQGKNLSVTNPDELKRFIEENVFLTYIQTQFDGMQSSNYPNAHKTFLEIVEGLNYPIADFVKIIYEGDGKFFANGMTDALFLDGFHRDGVKCESLGGYNCRNLNVLFDICRTTDRIVSQYPTMFPESEYPRTGGNKKFITAVESQIKHATTPYTGLVLGDGPTLTGYRHCFMENKKTEIHNKKSYTGDESAQFFEKIYSVFPSPKIAWALVNTEDWQPSEDFQFTRDQLQKKAAKLPSNWREKAELLPGPGVAIMRDGGGDDQRAVYCHFGVCFGHGHDSAMGLYLDAFKSRLMANWGYPSAWDRWYYNWMPQSTGRSLPLPNGYRDQNYLSCYNQLCATAGNIEVIDNKADMIADQYRGLQNMPPRQSCYSLVKEEEQRRINLLVNVSAKDFYVIDLYAMNRGKDQWRTFNTLDGSVHAENLELKKQIEGTLAGVDVPYDDKKWVEQNGGAAAVLGFTRLYNVEKAQSQNQPFNVTWNINDSAGLKVRLHCLEPDNAEIVLADAKDPNGATPFVRRFLLWHHTADRSRVLNLIEAFRGEPVIREAKSAIVSGDKDAVGIAVKLANRTDYFIISGNQAEKQMPLPGGMSMKLTGRIGYAALDNNNKVINMSLIEGTKLSCVNKDVTMGQSAYNAEIVAVDYPNWSFALQPEVPDPKELLDRNIFISRGGIKIGLEIRKAENREGKTWITVDCDPLVYAVRARSFKDGQIVFLADDPDSWFLNSRSGYPLYRLYHKTTLVSKDNKQFRLDTVGPQSLRFSSESELNAGELEKDFPKNSLVKVYDYGIGDRISVPMSKAERW